MSTGSSERADSMHATEDIKDKARQAGDEAKHAGKDQLERYRGTGADELARVAQSVKAAASDLERDRPGLSRYVANMAGGMERIADDLRGKSVDELFRDVNRLARQNPGLFIAGSVALGFGLMRFAKASSQHTAADYERHPVRDRMHELHDEHEQGDMVAHTPGDTYSAGQGEMKRQTQGETGASAASVSNAGGTRTDTLAGGVSSTTTRTTTTLDATTSSTTQNPTNKASGVTTRSDPRIRNAGTTPSNVNRDGKGGLQP